MCDYVPITMLKRVYAYFQRRAGQQLEEPLFSCFFVALVV